MADIESTLKELKADWKNFSPECKQAVINMHASNPSPCEKDAFALLAQAFDIKSAPNDYSDAAMEFADEVIDTLLKSEYAKQTYSGNKKA